MRVSSAPFRFFFLILLTVSSRACRIDSSLNRVSFSLIVEFFVPSLLCNLMYAVDHLRSGYARGDVLQPGWPQLQTISAVLASPSQNVLQYLVPSLTVHRQLG